MRMMSAVLVQAQKPQTILGLPARLFALVLVAPIPMPLVTLAMIRGSEPVAMVLWALCLVLAWGWAWRLARNDHHYDRLLFFAPQFWKLRRGPTRTLIAGRPRP